MHAVTEIIGRFKAHIESKRGQPMSNPFDDMPTAQKPAQAVSRPVLSRRRSKIVNKAHVAALFITLEMEYGALFSKQVAGKENTVCEYWLKRLVEAGIDEMALNEAMARLPAKYPPKIGELIDLCRPHTYEAKVGHIEKYSGARPEPGAGYEQFRAYVDKHGRRSSV